MKKLRSGRILQVDLVAAADRIAVATIQYGLPPYAEYPSPYSTVSQELLWCMEYTFPISKTRDSWFKHWNVGIDRGLEKAMHKLTGGDETTAPGGLLRIGSDMCIVDLLHLFGINTLVKLARILMGEVVDEVSASAHSQSELSVMVWAWWTRGIGINMYRMKDVEQVPTTNVAGARRMLLEHERLFRVLREESADEVLLLPKMAVEIIEMLLRLTCQVGLVCRHRERLFRMLLLSKHWCTDRRNVCSCRRPC